MAEKDLQDADEHGKRTGLPSHVPPDGGYGWVIVACVFAIQLFFVGTMNMYGVYLYDLTDYLGASQAAMGLVSSVDMVLNSVAGQTFLS